MAGTSIARAGAVAVPAGAVAGSGPEEPARPEPHPATARRTSSPVSGVRAAMAVLSIRFSGIGGRGAVRPAADDRLTTGPRQGSFRAVRRETWARRRGLPGHLQVGQGGSTRFVFPTMEMPKMPQGSLRRFPLVGAVLAF